MQISWGHVLEDWLLVQIIWAYVLEDWLLAQIIWAYVLENWLFAQISRGGMSFRTGCSASSHGLVAGSCSHWMATPLLLSARNSWCTFAGVLTVP